MKEQSKEQSKVIKEFIQHLYCMSGTGNGIGVGTVDKIKKFAMQYHYIEEENK
jgi:hypothetical protein